MLALGGEDLRRKPWKERDEQLATALPAGPRIRLVQSQPAALEDHRKLVELGFEGTVLKRAGSTYRDGRHNTWRKYKARQRVAAVLLELRTGRDGKTYAVCEHDGTQTVAAAFNPKGQKIGDTVDIIYSRRDANGSLREPRIASPTDIAHARSPAVEIDRRPGDGQAA